MSADVDVIHGDCLEAMRRMADASVDAVVTDPPYGLEFMGREWDSFGSSKARAGMSKPGIGDRDTAWPSFFGGLNPRCQSCGHSQRGGSPCRCDNPVFSNERGQRARAFQAFCEQWAAEVFRVLKPGAHLLAFGGTRTYHRMTCAIEDAGFEIRDSLHWIYGSGFPKSLNLEGEWNGFGTALKPSHEPIVLARKPLDGTVAQNVAEHGTGALNIDGCRVSTEERLHGVGVHDMRGGAFGAGHRPNPGDLSEYEPNPAGRWPANLALVHHPLCRPCGTKRVKGSNGVNHVGEGGQFGTDIYNDSNGRTAESPRGYGDEEVEAWECVEGLCPVAEMDRQSGERKSGGSVSGGDHYALAGYEHGIAGRREAYADRNDSGGASRFFPTFAWEADDFAFAPFMYCGKATTEERNAGLAGMPVSERDTEFMNSAMCLQPDGELHEKQRIPRANGHPTVKPVALLQWLTRLITPPGGLILDCFLGSGTTAVAAIREGFRLVGIEKEAEYIAIAEARIAEARRRVERPHAPVVKVNGHKRRTKAMPLFDLLGEGDEP